MASMAHVIVSCHNEIKGSFFFFFHPNIATLHCPQVGVLLGSAGGF